LHIDAEEQLRRFEERQSVDYKQWKITEEDWRNREKWDAYKEAVEEMLFRTSTPYAPWTIVESNCKWHARVKVLETACKAITKRLKE
jgi:polyphosphate kinase 2 (PPK2 family)